jgi:hypothetical protein
MHWGAESQRREVWVLLHFHYSTAPFSKAGSESACDGVVKAVKRHLPAYAKGHPNAFEELAPRLNDALKHAKLLEKHNAASGSQNPGTRIHQLVEYLVKLKTN